MNQFHSNRHGRQTPGRRRRQSDVRALSRKLDQEFRVGWPRMIAALEHPERDTAAQRAWRERNWNRILRLLGALCDLFERQAKRHS